MRRMKPIPGTHAGTWRTKRESACDGERGKKHTGREEVDEGRDGRAERDGAADSALGEDDKLVVEGGDAMAVRNVHHHRADVPSAMSSASRHGVGEGAHRLIPEKTFAPMS